MIDDTLLNEYFKTFLEYLNTNSVNHSILLLNNLIETSEDKREIYIKEENEFHANCWYLYECYFLMFKYYLETLEHIKNGKYIKSWGFLQDSIGCLKLLNRYEDKYKLPKLEFFNKKLIELEKLYPFRIFASIGGVFRSIKCNICGEQVYSSQCEHITGQLYMGELAQRELGDAIIDHIALVSKPYDKRCIVMPENNDNNSQFEILKEFISYHKHVLLLFNSKVIIKYNQLEMPVNAKCSCGSGKKYKFCCGSKEKRAYNHLDIKFLKIYQFDDEFPLTNNIHTNL